MFSKFEEKNFKTFRSSFNTIFKQKIISHDLKLLLNFACYFHEDISEKAINVFFGAKNCIDVVKTFITNN